MIVEEIVPKSILTRTGGFLATVCSHSLQTYAGCSLGRSLCGVGCYAQHQMYRTRGRPWGGYLDAKTGADQVYRAQFARESAWARRKQGRFGVFMSSSTEPFPPQESKYGVTASVLAAMIEAPPDRLIVQTHSPLVIEVLETLQALNGLCEVRVHMSIESDRDRLPGLPGPFASVKRRMNAIGRVREAGIFSVVTVSPLLPIRDPHGFFGDLAEVADAVVLDHYVGGDGSKDGSRTRRTALPKAMREVEPASDRVEYRDAMAEIAASHFPCRVGIGPDGFAGRYIGQTATEPAANAEVTR